LNHAVGTGKIYIRANCFNIAMTAGGGTLTYNLTNGTFTVKVPEL
jgi:hypothetical protein